MTNSKVRTLQKLEDIYREVPPEQIPWNMTTPPEQLMDLCHKKIRSCKTIDLGCGTGNYARYLTQQGFEVTGIDSSPTAIKISKENACKKGLQTRFLVRDVLGDLNEFKGTFDFAYDWEMLHHLYPVDRQRYVKNVHRLLRPHGKYLSVCFSEKDTHFGGSGKYRKTPLGTVLYFSSEKELQKLFEPLFYILELKTIEVRGKTGPHSAIYAFMEKKQLLSAAI